MEDLSLFKDHLCEETADHTSVSRHTSYFKLFGKAKVSCFITSFWSRTRLLLISYHLLAFLLINENEAVAFYEVFF